MRDRRYEGSRGHGLVEFAAVLPVIVLLLFGLFDAGRAVLFYTELTNASRAGARVAIINQSNDAACSSTERTFKCAAAEMATAMAITPGSIADLTIAGTDCALPSNCAATVTVDYLYQPTTPVIGSIIGSINLSSSTTMPIERIYANP